jgi:uncharacterized protein YbaR (Trm112 family)
VILLKCPKCQSKLEIDDKKQQELGVTAVFCTNEECTFNKQPLIGIDRKESEVWLSESIV